VARSGGYVGSGGLHGLHGFPWWSDLVDGLGEMMMATGAGITNAC
jgi:hypothetical protein